MRSIRFRGERRRITVRALVASGLGSAVTAVFTLVLASAASAHVTVQPSEAKQGGFTAVVFRTPNERPEPTVKLEVQLPRDHPIAAVSVKPVPGWSYEVTKRTIDKPIDLHGRQVTEVVDTITWSGGEIKPGEYQEFPVSLGPLPAGVDELVFPAIQTYASGEEVRWVERQQPGQEEPERPAPVLKLVSAGDDGEHESSGSGPSSTAMPTAGPSASMVVAAPAGDVVSAQDTADRAEKFAMAGIAVGLVALIVGIWSVIAGRRQAES
ncbi:MAG: YcnI family protein [Acidimicrobiales bacterium]|nr:YcnI family protein [Acidimicrobiales bacterium]